MFSTLDTRELRGFLFDLDGVLYVGSKAIPGAALAIEHIRSKGMSCRFLTNTTTKSLDQLFLKIAGLGLPIEKNEILSAPQAAVRYLRRKGSPTCHLVLSEDTKTDFEEFPRSDKDPAFVVLGDIGDRWDYRLLNGLFTMLVGGSTLIALHKGRYWQTDEGLSMDIGAFVAALEYTTGKEAVVMGKPSRVFFETALADMGLEPYEAVMVGDDIESDIGGAQRAGIQGILVKTGKYRDELVAGSSVVPDAVIPSAVDLLSLELPIVSG